MGRVITTNSATLVNKGLELLEAHLLYGVDLDRIDVVVHPQSIVHSMVQFVDGSTLAQCSPPDMRLPIALGLSWPDRLPRVAAACDWSTASSWTFEPLDDEAFPAVELARRCRPLRRSAPAVYNAANEECVDAFHDGEIALPGHRRHRGGRAGRAHPLAEDRCRSARRRLDVGRRTRSDPGERAGRRRVGPAAGS